MGQKQGKPSRYGEESETSTSSPRRSPRSSPKRKAKSLTSESSPRKPPRQPPLEETIQTTSVTISESQPQHQINGSPPPSPQSEKTEFVTPKKSYFNGGEPLEPLTPLIIEDPLPIPKATSTPAPNGVISTGSAASSPPMSPDSGTDQSDDEAFTSDQQFRSESPSSSITSLSTNSSIRRLRSDSNYSDRSSTPNFGKFYNQSYLGKAGGRGGYLTKPNTTPKQEIKSHFHRPQNFSYAKEAPSFTKPKGGSGMMALASTGTKVVKTRRSVSPAHIRNQEAVRMSTYPAAKPPPPNEITKIEREDWPGPPSPAAMLPEILAKRRKSRGEKDDDDEDEPLEDPKILKELQEISKIKDESGIGRVIFRELEERKALPSKPLDPWKASRAPSAKYEPKFDTRFKSPMFASPSRFLDRTKRSWDDSDIRGYRTISAYSNFPSTKPGYGTYQLTPRAATLPLEGYYGGSLHRYFQVELDHDGDRLQRSAYNSTSTMSTEASSRREVRSRGSGSGVFEDGPSVSMLTYQRSTWHTEAEPPIYPYEKLKITNFDLPRDVDRNLLEIHLADEDFQSLFKMSREKFYKYAEWKRNDIKKRLDLY